MKYRWIAGAVLAAMCCLNTGCAKNVELSIQDMGENRHFAARTGMTVEEALDQANFELGKKDETNPARDTKLTEQTKQIQIKRHVKVTVIDADGNAQAVELAGGTVRDALKQAGVTLKKGQYVKPEKKTYLTDEMEIRVCKKHTVALTADGKKKTVQTKANTVGDLLYEQDITIQKDDIVSPRQDRLITDKVTKVTVKRVKYKRVRKTEYIPYETKIRYSSKMEEGRQRVMIHGVRGKKKMMYRVKYVDGKRKSRKIIKETVVRNPVDEVIVYGTKAS